MWSLALIGNASAGSFESNKKLTRSVFDEESWEEVAGVCGGRGMLWGLNRFGLVVVSRGVARGES